ncbi:MAG TPA: serine hydrolase domain-containing protein, partial [Bacteroidota bacterium]|nr:serine hydrolase domain-containing protein [Bacteroidota bacterium]
MIMLRRAISLLAVLSVIARAQMDVESRIARVEKGLLPPVLIKGEGGWDIAERMRLYNTPGVSIAVIVNYQVDWAKGYGLKEAAEAGEVTPETIFQAGSISKSVTAMAALKLAELGELSLDQDVNGILKTWKLPESALSSQNKVTLTRLLSHSAGTTVHGFPGYEEGQPLPTIVQILDGLPPANTAPVRVDVVPGTIFRYSGGGTIIVQCALIDREQMSFPEIMKRRV